MPEEDLEAPEQEDGEKPEQTFSPEESQRRQIRALERKLAEAEKKAAWSEMKSKYALSDEDRELFKEIPVSKWEAIAARVAPKEEAPEAPAPEAPQVSEAERKALEGFSKTAGGTGPSSATISFAEAKALGGLSNPDVRRMAEAGLIEGLKPPPVHR